ncbi:MAG: hypothetical protein MHM6MM_003024 [Cercozoa sp. M6MM]
MATERALPRSKSPEFMYDESDEPVQTQPSRPPERLNNQCCPICHKLIRCDLIQHLDAVHLGLLRFRCPKCEYKRPRKVEVTTHLIDKHGKQHASEVESLLADPNAYLNEVTSLFRHLLLEKLTRQQFLRKYHACAAQHSQGQVCMRSLAEITNEAIQFDNARTEQDPDPVLPERPKKQRKLKAPKTPDRTVSATTDSTPRRSSRRLQAKSTPSKSSDSSSETRSTISESDGVLIEQLQATQRAQDAIALIEAACDPKWYARVLGAPNERSNDDHSAVDFIDKNSIGKNDPTRDLAVATLALCRLRSVVHLSFLLFDGGYHLCVL